MSIFEKIKEDLQSGGFENDEIENKIKSCYVFIQFGPYIRIYDLHGFVCMIDYNFTSAEDIKSFMFGEKDLPEISEKYNDFIKGKI